MNPKATGSGRQIEMSKRARFYLVCLFYTRYQLLQSNQVHAWAFRIANSSPLESITRRSICEKVNCFLVDVFLLLPQSNPSCWSIYFTFVRSRLRSLSLKIRPK